MHRLLAINPGSTSTKFAVYFDTECVLNKTIRHSFDDLFHYENIIDQFDFRKGLIIDALVEEGIEVDSIKFIIGRGGLTYPVESGIYRVNHRMLQHVREGVMGEHASNLGGFIADDIAKSLPNARAFIADPVVVDELEPHARVSGHPEFERKSIFHALNQKATARQHAKSIMRKYEDLNLIVVHLGGGISVGAHKKGLVVDVNQALDGEGPFSPERSGTLPAADLVRACFSGKFTQKELLQMIKGKGGMTAFLGTNSAFEVEKRAEAGDEYAKFIFEAMAYQVAKAIGAMSTVLKGDVDGILITGGIAHGKWFVNQVIERVYKIAPVHVYPGEDEMRALAINGLMVLKGEVEVKEYR